MASPNDELVSKYRPVFMRLPSDGEKDPIFNFTIGEFEDIVYSPATQKEGKQFNLVYDTDLCGQLDKLIIPQEDFGEFESEIGAFDINAFIQSVQDDMIRVYDLAKSMGLGSKFGDYAKLTFYNEYLDFDNEDLKIDLRDRIGYLTSPLGQGEDRENFIAWVNTRMKDEIFSRWVSHCNKQSELMPGIVKQIATVKLYMVSLYFTKTIPHVSLERFIDENN